MKVSSPIVIKRIFLVILFLIIIVFIFSHFHSYFKIIRYCDDLFLVIPMILFGLIICIIKPQKLGSIIEVSSVVVAITIFILQYTTVREDEMKMILSTNLHNCATAISLLTPSTYNAELILMKFKSDVYVGHPDMLIKMYGEQNFEKIMNISHRMDEMNNFIDVSNQVYIEGKQLNKIDKNDAFKEIRDVLCTLNTDLNPLKPIESLGQ